MVQKWGERFCLKAQYVSYGHLSGLQGNVRALGLSYITVINQVSSVIFVVYIG
jgi:hypothetical protein